MADLNNRNDMNEFDEDDDRVFEFIDEDGTTTLFEHLATIEYQGDLYLVLTTPENEVEENTEEEEMDIHILKIEQDENGQDIYVSPDEDVMEAVFNEFLRQIDEEEE